MDLPSWIVKWGTLQRITLEVARVIVEVLRRWVSLRAVAAASLLALVSATPTQVPRLSPLRRRGHVWKIGATLEPRTMYKLSG